MLAVIEMASEQDKLQKTADMNKVARASTVCFLTNATKKDGELGESGAVAEGRVSGRQQKKRC